MSEVEYELYEGQPVDAVLGWVAEASRKVFGPGDVAEYRRSLEGKRNILICLAVEQGVPVGFKIGFEERQYYFESWRGGVVETARGRGIAEQMLRLQHAWCEQQDFRIISTTCSNDNVPMITLNMRNGLLIVGTFFDRKKHPKVILQKHIDAGE